MTFESFGPQLFEFLCDLEQNNNRDWFNANKARYEADVREPARAFVRAMAPKVLEISPHLLSDDRKVGGSLMRIYRDTRFSKDKTPYKTNVGIQFRHTAGKDVHAPGLYVHIMPAECWLGVGSWRPDSPTLRGIREAIADKPESWQAVLEEPGFRDTWEPGGESLKRAPKGFAPDHPAVDELKRKDFISMSRLEPGEVMGPGFVELVAERFGRASGYMGFLCAAIGQPF